LLLRLLVPFGSLSSDIRRADHTISRFTTVLLNESLNIPRGPSPSFPLGSFPVFGCLGAFAGRAVATDAEDFGVFAILAAGTTGRPRSLIVIELGPVGRDLLTRPSSPHVKQHFMH
jgi:hypothetical protein